jgi:hypothetical protein
MSKSFVLLFLLIVAGYGQTLPLPGRATNAPTATEFLTRIAPLDLDARENQIAAQVLAGNIPDFLRKLTPVRVVEVSEGKTNTATYYVTPDYLAIGSDDDYFLTPMSPRLAQHLCDALLCLLPTRKMVDDIYRSSALKLEPSPIPPSPAMTTVEVFSNHNAMIRSQRFDKFNQYPLGTLVAGHKKDVVISPRLATAPGKVAIYGWHKTNGSPIQPLYLGHTAAWVDYSQCIRLVQEKMESNGEAKSASEVLASPSLSRLLSDEGPILSPRYVIESEKTEANSVTNGKPATPRLNGFAGFQPNPYFDERIASWSFEPGVKIGINAPAERFFESNKPVLLIVYALPNGNTTDQTIGKMLKPGDDWHYNIQHIGAQTRYLRELLPDRSVVVAYFENELKSWPAWRKQHGDNAIPGIVDSLVRLFPSNSVETVLAGHSGGGSLIFGYLNAVDHIPENVERIAFLDSNYAYDSKLGHLNKLVKWLKGNDHHFLCVLAYNDAVALLDGKTFVSAAGGTWGKSHEMLRDLSKEFKFSAQTNSLLESYSALDGQLQFLLMENPDRKILHTVQVELNGFIHSMVSGTTNEGRGYQYFGPRAYSKWIQQGN